MRIIATFLFALCSIWCWGEQQDTSRIRISVLTAGTGTELYSMFGHSGVRVIDSVHNTDEVYNYGLFNFSDPDFYTKFTQGKLLYFVGKEEFNSFMSIYREENRNVMEELLDLPMQDKYRILHYLTENLKPEHRSYKYDFLYDNCATRIRDIFPRNLDTSFHFGPVLNAQKATFRAILNDYLKTAHWSRLGINILLASRIDKEMTDEEAMFLPDMLFAGMKRSTYHQRVIVSEIATLHKGADKIKAGPNQPLWVMMGVLLLTLLIFFVKPLHRLKAAWAFILLLISGLLGCFLLFMWFGTDHRSCGNNYNLLWAFPLNLLAAFTLFRPRRWHVPYALFVVGLLLIALLVHAIGLQVMPLIEILPFLISLLYSYMFIYKRALSLRTA